MPAPYLSSTVCAHGAFGDRLHGAFGLLDVEQVIAHAIGLDLPQHREIDVDDVLVAGEHQTLLRHVADRGTSAQVLDHPHADVDLVDAQRLRGQHRLDRIRQVIVQSRLHLAHVFAEAQHHAELVGIDAEKAGKAPDRDRGEHNQAQALAAETTARQHGAQPILAAAQKFLEVWRCRAGRLLARAPRAFASSRSPGAAALIAPRHRLSPRWAGQAPPCFRLGL
jgi:hypothetical protein